MAMVHSTSVQTDVRNFRRLWNRWRRVLDHFARARKGKPISAVSYQQLHRELLAVTSDHLEKGSENLRPALEQMEKLIRPWMSLDSLAAANRNMLARMAVQARRVEIGVFGRIAAFSGIKIVAGMLTLTLVLGVGVLLLTHWHVPEVNGGYVDQLLIELKRSTWRLLSYSDPYRTTMAALIALLVGAWLVTSTQRY